DALARPPELQPAVDFWRRVYTEITTNEGFIHDDTRLDIVYETVRLSTSSDKSRRLSVDDAGDRYVRALRSVANGKRENLTPAEKRVMELWGPNIDKDALLDASDRVRFQLGQADKFREGLIRSGAWEHYIKKTLADAGLPPEIASLPHVESSFNPLARSKVGAAGMWQFMVSTGRRFMRIDNVVDERLDPYKSTRAAALLMQQNYEVTRAWPLAITAYNHGAAGMRRAIEQTGTDDIAVIVRKYKSRSFGFASRNFYTALLAAVDVDEDPTKYFGVLDRHPPDNSRVLVMPDYVAVGALARTLGVERNALEPINLALKPAVWNGSKKVPKGFELRVPMSAGDPQMMLASLPRDAWTSKQTPDTVHVVQRGETLSSIAPRYGTRVADLIALNSLSSAARIKEGQTLVLPGGAAKNVAAEPVAVDRGAYPNKPADVQQPIPATTVAAVTEAANTTAIADATDAEAAAGPDQEEVPAGTPPTPAEAKEVVDIEQRQLLADPSDYSVGEDRTIRVQEDETIGHYADWLGVRATDLRKLNGMKGTSALRVGKRMKLDFSKVTPEQFEAARLAYHQNLQEQFFANHQIVATSEHVVKPGESIWVLAGHKYNIPVWLLRQYNPDLDLSMVKPSTRVVIPVLAGPGA
ncbi:MAG TPA: LysM peptidoglycan-binding domain-containing protein, partial [Pseudomonadales bacterium]|nr:LysM peptidoglycan-binding domain-containing protein [Pseudomonadales bacterium]